MSRKQSGYIMGLERETGHTARWISREAGGMRKAYASELIRELTATRELGRARDESLHADGCPGCALDRI